MDLIWAPDHDGLAGGNVIATLTSPHPFSAAQARGGARGARPPPRRAARAPARRSSSAAPAARMIPIRPPTSNGSRRRRRRSPRAGYSVMATPSRRTPPELVGAVRAGLGDAPAFVWDGTGANPYAQMLAHAEAILVTGDSVNMVGEATATGAPVHIFEPSGGAGGKVARYIDALERLGAVRRFAGRIERFSYAPIDSSLTIAREIARRFALGGRVPIIGLLNALDGKIHGRGGNGSHEDRYRRRSRHRAGAPATGGQYRHVRAGDGQFRPRRSPTGQPAGKAGRAPARGARAPMRRRRAPSTSWNRRAFSTASKRRSPICISSMRRPRASAVN